MNLLKKEKKKYYNNLNLKDIADKMFWKKVKPLFTERSKLKTNTTLVESDKVITEKEDIAEILNNYFIEAVQNLEIEKFTYGGDHEETQNQSENINDVLDNICRTYKSHPSILKIRENVQIEEKNNFVDATEDEILLGQ